MSKTISDQYIMEGLIPKVLNYARKNKYPRNYKVPWPIGGENYPSRLDLGKLKYGGPFIEEDIESVKGIYSIF